MKDIADPERYALALEALRREGLPPKHEALLREHWRSRRHTTTWVELARKAGYETGEAVSLEYGALAARIGGRLGLSQPPHPRESPEPDWLLVLVLVASKKGPRGQLRYILRRNLIEAMARVGMISESEAS